MNPDLDSFFFGWVGYSSYLVFVCDIIFESGFGCHILSESGFKFGFFWGELFFRFGFCVRHNIWIRIRMWYLIWIWIRISVYDQNQIQIQIIYHIQKQKMLSWSNCLVTGDACCGSESLRSRWAGRRFLWAFGRRGLQRSVFLRGFSCLLGLPAKLSCRVRDVQFRLSWVRCSEEGTVDEALGQTSLIPFTLWAI